MSQVDQMEDPQIARAVYEFKATFRRDTGKALPLSPEGYVWDWLADRDGVALIEDLDLGSDENERLIGGNTVESPNGGAIYINKEAVGKPFYAFTLAHEIGHWILHRRFLGVSGSGSVGLTGEWQANRFAVHLLMPEAEVRCEFTQRFAERERAYGVLSATPAFRLRHPTLQDYTRWLSKSRGGMRKSLIERFSVSAAAMAIRLEELGLVYE